MDSGSGAGMTGFVWAFLHFLLMEVVVLPPFTVMARTYLDVSVVLTCEAICP
ncbi:MAG: hypothetical protein LBU87_03450 [Lactobacillales bacterium]|jgi:hypothetical protein|nr:hypothetical protein [Lactobacillales bacterium]